MLVLAAGVIAIAAFLWLLGRPSVDYTAHYKVGGRPAWMNIEHPPGRYADWSGLSVAEFDRTVGPTYAKVAAMLTLSPEIFTLFHNLEESARASSALAHTAAVVYYCSALFGNPITAEAAFVAAGTVYYEPGILTEPEVASGLATDNEDLFAHQPPLGIGALLSAAEPVLATAPFAVPSSQLAALRPWETTSAPTRRKAE